MVVSSAIYWVTDCGAGFGLAADANGLIWNLNKSARGMGLYNERTSGVLLRVSIGGVTVVREHGEAGALFYDSDDRVDLGVGERRDE
jgi:hypothetical protein